MTDEHSPTDQDSGGQPDPPSPDERQANVEAMAYWDRVIEDMEATATDFEERGWDSLQLHPGDVHVLPDLPGLDVLVGDDEFEQLTDWFEDETEITETEVLKAATEGMQYLVAVMQDPHQERAVLAPVYYRQNDPDSAEMFSNAERAGSICTRLRVLSGDGIDVHHDQPSLFAPEKDETA